MVKYNRIAIIFYAVVDNYSREICWPCEESFALFKKHGLDMVKAETIGLYNNFDVLCDGLYRNFIDVSKSRIAEDEEGSVLYLIKRDKKNPERDTVLSLFKLKTLEYRLFRKMREKLRRFFRPKEPSKKTEA